MVGYDATAVIDEDADRPADVEAGNPDERRRARGVEGKCAVAELHDSDRPAGDDEADRVRVQRAVVVAVRPVTEEELDVPRRVDRLVANRVDLEVAGQRQEVTELDLDVRQLDAELLRRRSLDADRLAVDRDRLVDVGVRRVDQQVRVRPTGEETARRVEAERAAHHARDAGARDDQAAGAVRQPHVSEAAAVPRRRHAGGADPDHLLQAERDLLELVGAGQREGRAGDKNLQVDGRGEAEVRASGHDEVHGTAGVGDRLVDRRRAGVDRDLEARIVEAEAEVAVTLRVADAVELELAGDACRRDEEDTVQRLDARRRRTGLQVERARVAEVERDVAERDLDRLRAARPRRLLEEDVGAERDARHAQCDATADAQQLAVCAGEADRDRSEPGRNGEPAARQRREVDDGQHNTGGRSRVARAVDLDRQARDRERHAGDADQRDRAGARLERVVAARRAGRGRLEQREREGDVAHHETDSGRP